MAIDIHSFSISFPRVVAGAPAPTHANVFVETSRGSAQLAVPLDFTALAKAVYVENAEGEFLHDLIAAATAQVNALGEE